VVPADIAQIVVSPKSHTRDEVIYRALAWLRANNPLGSAQVPDFYDLWIVTKHADVMAIERDANLFRSGDQKPILNDQASDGFIRDLNNGSIRSLHSLTFMDLPEHGANRSVAAG
jgi:cytochrome P450